MYIIKNTSRKSVIVILACFFLSILFISQPFADPVALYHFDGDAVDASGNGYDLTVCEGNVTWIEGIYGQAAFMKQGNPYFHHGFTGTSGVSYSGSGGWTVEAWVKLPGYGDCYNIFSEHGFLLKINYSEAEFIINPNYIGDGQPHSATAALSFGPGRWFHIAGVYKYEEIFQFYIIQIYINGELAGDAATELVPTTSSPEITWIYIGQNINLSTTGGFAVDELAVHHAALKPDEFYGLQVHKLPDATITGYITDSSTGEALQSAGVTVTPGDYREVTDSNGKYFVEVFGGSDYTVTVNKTNYTTTAQNGVTVEDDTTVDVNVALERFSTSPTVAYYHFDGNGADASGNGYDLTVHEKITWVDGIQGKAGMVMSKIGDYPFVPTSYGLYYPGSGDWTIETYIRLQDYDSVCNIWNNGSIGVVALMGNIAFDIHPSNGQSVMPMVPMPVDVDEWAHIACVYRYKESMQIYGNGELLKEEKTDKVPKISPPWIRTGIGTGAFTAFMIDELRISSAALSPEEFLYQGIVSVEESETPQEFSFSGNYPNPFNLTTTIEFSLSEAGFTELSIYNIMGQKIRELVTDTMQAGIHSVVWDGKDDSGNDVASGLYLSRLVSGEHVAANSMLLLK